MARERAEANPEQAGETTSAYFRRVFKKHPSLLRDTSIKAVMDMYFEDHPHDTEDLGRVKGILYNLKSVLRGEKRRKKELRIATAAAVPEIAEAPPPAVNTPNELEVLEEHIDECLALAKGLDRVLLANVIDNLRLARNAVVLRQGQ